VSELTIRRVLVVDDEPDILAVIRMTLRAHGDHEVEVCQSGREALELAPRFEPDLILLDVMMPEMDGPMTLAALRDSPRTATIPVVFMTAKAMRHETERYLDLGAVGVVAKPFDPGTLVGELERIVTGGSKPTRPDDRDMTELLERYASGLPTKIREVRNLWDQVEGGTENACDRLRKSVHRIAGTAGTFGYTSVSEIAGQLEEILRDHLSLGLELSNHKRKRLGLLVDALEKAAFEQPRSIT
jgi:CheY-like chemotaxis protein